MQRTDQNVITCPAPESIASGAFYPFAQETEGGRSSNRHSQSE